jgi:NADH-quinone oxidoreductase subunit L
MFVGVGVLAPVSAVFHLVTHAFFKALLFLSSGVVMHAMLGHLDMRKMSGLKRVLPMTNILMLIGCLALAGFPMFSGFFSKDDIVGAAAAYSPILWVVLLFTGFLTAYYTFRLYFQVFQGPLLQPDAPAETPAHDDHAHDAHGHDDHAHDAHGHGGHHNHEPALMIVPLMVLAVGALFGGLFNFHTNALGDFLGKSPSFQLSYEVAKSTRGIDAAEGFGQAAPEFVPGPLILGGAISIIGIALAFWLHLVDRAKSDELATALGPLTRLLEAKYWVDEIYQALIVDNLRAAGEFFFAIDRYIVDGLVALAGAIPQIGGFVLKLTTERGYLQGYAATMLLGIAVILLIVFAK